MNELTDFRHITEKLLDSNPQEDIFFLLDHGGLPGLSQQLQHCSTEWASLFARTQEAGALAVAPILVLAASSGEIRLSRLVFNWLKRHGSYSSSLMLLVSPLNLTPLVGRLGTRLHINLEGGVEAMLRYFDPRVFESLLGTMTPEQTEHFLGVASSWCYVDRAGRVVQTKAKFIETELTSTSLSLSQTQEDLLLEASEIDQILSSMRSSAPDIFLEIPYASQFSFVVESVSEARKEKLESRLQMSLYTLIRLFGTKKIIPVEVHQKAIGYLKSKDINNLKIFLNENFIELSRRVP